MSDNLGPNQTRVLDSVNRSFESVVYQKRKPPLSCEVNLGGKIDEQRNQLAMKSIMPSGVSFVGPIVDASDASLYEAGSVICNSSLVRNTFKFVALDKGQDAQLNTAWVNGWRVLIQGTNSLDEDNIVILDEPPSTGTGVDFVFLEVWRKLLSSSSADPVLKFGNWNYGGINYTNDLIDPAMGIETSLRVQTQYRIRTAKGIDIASYPEGFDPSVVFVQGPNSAPVTSCIHNYFSPVPGDPGLWVGGSGDPASVLGTVDGYTYAIPLFAICRRCSSAYDTYLQANGSSRTLADYRLGNASDRPDNLYNDWIVAEDILDLRHRVVAQENLRELCENAFEKLVNNRLPGKLTNTGFGTGNYGIHILQPDAIAPLPSSSGSELIGHSDGIRRIFSNAQLDQSESFVVRTPLTPWAVGSSVSINLSSGSYPAGSQIISIQEIFDNQNHVIVGPSGYDVSGLNTDTVVITLNSSATTILTFSYPITIEYTIRYPSGTYGLSQVPELFLECRKEGTNTSIAMQDIDIRVRDSSAVISSIDGTNYNMLRNHGGNPTELFDFGHQMVYHIVGTGIPTFTILKTIEGYDILGVVSVKVDEALQDINTVIRTATSYTVSLTLPVAVGKDIEVVLYTKNKFFEANKQGRGITDCWEMLEVVPDEDATGGVTFHVDTTNKAILGIAALNGLEHCYAYVDGRQTPLTTSNTEFPYDSTKTYGAITFSVAPNPGSVIEVPLLVRSAITDSEGYTFFYKTLPYQGLLDNSATGSIEAVGPAITTTAGSGAITSFTYSVGTATSSDNTVITGVGTDWSNNVKAGQYIKSSTDISSEYLIDEVYNNETLFLSNKVQVAFSGAYTISEKDQAFYLQRNIIDLLPTLSSLNDASGKSVSISTAVSDGYPVLDTRIISRVQDIEALPKGTVWVGQNSADRGRSAVHISDSTIAPLGMGNLGLKFEKLSTTAPYHKTYQSYIINKNDSGYLYLLVVGSETDNTSTGSCFFNHASSRDSVDIFELPGRPLLMRRIV
jgi:hypothetical protein